MKAFIVKFEQLFKMDTGKKELENFCPKKRRLLIPLYQREYIWPDEKIITLVNDISDSNKYLGNIILDEAESCYEIVDGQQRITTCFLILACLYNFYNNHHREQEMLMDLMKPYGDKFVLENNSVDEYIIKENGLLSINIKKEKDVYYQTRDFQRAFSAITKEIQKFKNYGEARKFKQKLMDCEILVLIHDQHNYTHPVEQLFLDINEKAELLQPEDIFKGHCFENYEELAHNDLKDLWVELKKCAMGFKNFFGFKDTSEYLYLYLMETDNTSISQNFILNGKHYLTGKTMDDTEMIVKEIISYGQAVLNFYNNLLISEYRFDDLCSNSYEYRDTKDHIVLKQMCKTMLNFKSAQYQKLPFMYFIYSLQNNKKSVSSMSHIQFRKIITNLYVYMMLFILSGAKKSKGNIDHTIRDAINKNDSIEQLIISAKTLRVKKIEEFTLRENFDFDKLSFIYSIIDEYKANDNWIKKIYSRENGYTLEHFIIPDNRNGKISWNDDSNSFEFNLATDIVKANKKATINYLVLEKDLNESLEHDDIVSKICKIKYWYKVRDKNLPVHILNIIEFIEGMPQYQKLRDLKGHEDVKQSDIEQYYLDFVTNYFNVENENICKRIEQKFVDSFQNT